jgi:hypothetical protein
MAVCIDHSLEGTPDPACVAVHRDVDEGLGADAVAVGAGGADERTVGEAAADVAGAAVVEAEPRKALVGAGE